MPRRRRVSVDKKNEPVQREVGANDAVDELDCPCPALDPGDWHEVESDWSDITFIRLHIPALFGVPLGYGKLKTRAREAAEKIGAVIPLDGMVLMGAGRLIRTVLVEAESDDKEARGLVRPRGVVFSCLFSAPYGSIGRRLKETRAKAIEHYGKKPNAIWTWYLTCNKCSAPRDFETLFVAHYKRE